MPDHRNHISGRQDKVDPANGGILRQRRTRLRDGGVQRDLRAWHRQTFGRLRVGFRQSPQRFVGATRRQKRAPLPDQLVNRCQRTRQHDCACNHHTCGGLPGDRQRGPKAQHAGLQRHTCGLGNHRKARNPVRHTRFELMGLMLQSRPATSEITSHTHCLDELCVLLTCGEQSVGPCTGAGGILHHFRCARVVHKGHNCEENRTTKTKSTKVGMQQKEHADVQRNPGGIKEGGQRGAGDEISQAGHIGCRIVARAFALHPFAHR